MKRLISALLIIVMILSLTACESTSKALEVMETDTSTTNMLVKAALNTYLARIDTTFYYGKTADEATVDDVLIDSLCDDSRYVNDYLYGDKNWLSRTIGGDTYTMVWDGKNVVMSGGDNVVSGTTLTGSTKISSLDTSDYP